jgi:hypothetical protein
MRHQPVTLRDITAGAAIDQDARGFVHYVRAFAARQLDTSIVDELRAALGPTHGLPARFEKAAVGATTGTADPLHLQNVLAQAFLTRVAGRGLRGSIPWLPLPPQVHAPIASTTGTAGFVAEGVPIPVTRFDVGTAFLGGSKIPIICVFPRDLLRTPTDRVVSLLERHLARVIQEGEDRELLSDTAAVAGERPAGLLFGLSPIASGSPDSLAADIELLFAATRNGEPDRPWFIVSPRGALYLALLRGADGPMFPDIGVDGGSIAGVPVAVSKAAGNRLVLVDADGVGLWDGGLLIDRTQQATLQMETAPSAGPQNQVSMWQANAIAIRLIRQLDWARGYADAVNYIELPIDGSPA